MEGKTKARVWSCGCTSSSAGVVVYGTARLADAACEYVATLAEAIRVEVRHDAQYAGEAASLARALGVSLMKANNNDKDEVDVACVEPRAPAAPSLEARMVEVGSGKLLARFRLAINLVPLRELSCHAALNPVRIGRDEWADMNLDVRKFKDGGPIPEVRSYSKWATHEDSETPRWCHYGNDEANCAKYGKLYWFPNLAAMERICADGWEIPTVAQLDEMMTAAYFDAYNETIDVTDDTNREGEVAKKLLVALRDGPFRAVLGGMRIQNGDFEPMLQAGTGDTIGRWIVREQGLLREVGFRADGSSVVVLGPSAHGYACSVRLVRTASA